jgi:hypothetical protein
MRTWIRILLLTNQASTPPLRALKLLNFYFNADPDPAFQFSADPDYQNSTDPCESGSATVARTVAQIYGKLKNTFAMSFLVVITDFPKSLLKVSKFVAGEERLCG